jgi:hypothetical protein
MARKTKAQDPRSTREKQKEFLQAWCVTFSIVRAAEIARVSRDLHYDWCRKDKRYAQAFERRKDTATNYLESEAITRAGDGWLEPVYYQGDVCGQVRRFDSGLLQFLLRGLLPQKYGAKTEVSGPQGTPLAIKVDIEFVKPNDPTGSGNTGPGEIPG